MPFSSQSTTGKRGIRVRLPDGTTRESLSELARELGCKPQAFYRHIASQGGGEVVLGSLPNPHRSGPASPRYRPAEPSSPHQALGQAVDALLAAEQAGEVDGQHTAAVLAAAKRWRLAQRDHRSMP